MPMKKEAPRIPDPPTTEAAAPSTVQTMPFYGATLRDLRVAAGLTQAELAEKSGMKQSSIEAWEQGYRQPRADAIFKLAKVLGVKAETFMEEPAKKIKAKRGRPPAAP